MSIKLVEIIKGLLIKQEGVLNPAKVEILPGGTAGTKTTIQTAQTSDAVITLPAVTSTLASTAYVNSSSGTVNDLLDDHIADPSAAHAASAISTTSSNVQSDLNTISSTLTDLDSRLDTIESAVISDPVTKSYVDLKDADLTSTISTKLPLSGGTMTGNIEIGANKITSGADGIDFAGSAVRTYSGLGGEITVDSNVVIDANTIQVIGNNFDSFVDLNLNNIGKITNSIDPTSIQDLTTKNYVDTNDDILQGGITKLAVSNWTLRTGLLDSDWRSITYGNGYYVAVAGSGAGNRTMRSADNGITWTDAAAPVANTWCSVAYGYHTVNAQHTYVAVAQAGTANRVMRSAALGASWANSATLPVASQTMTWNSVAFGNNVFVAVSSEGAVIRSTDGGVNWTHISTAVTSGKTWNAITYVSGTPDKFVAVGASGYSMYSTDYGVTWSLGTVPASPAQWGAIAYGNGKYVAMDISNGYFMHSSNGITWTLGSSTPYLFASVVFSNGLFVALTGTNVIYTSIDGVTWSSVYYGVANNTWSSIASSGSGFIAVGRTGTGNRAMASLRM